MWKTEMESGILLSSLHPVIWDRVSPKLELGARNLPVCTLGVSADRHGIPLSQELRVLSPGLARCLLLRHFSYLRLCLPEPVVHHGHFPHVF